jgi:hypothetical protein
MIPIRLRAGCLGCSTWVDPDCTVHYEEDWASEAEIRERVASHPFTRLLGVIEASEGQPRVQFDFVTRTRGLDYVEEVRGMAPSSQGAELTGES